MLVAFVKSALVQQGRLPLDRTNDEAVTAALLAHHDRRVSRIYCFSL